MVVCMKLKVETHRIAEVVLIHGRHEFPKNNWKPKPYLVMKTRGEVPDCCKCKHGDRSALHIGCKYCSALSAHCTGNYFEPVEPIKPIAPVTEEGIIMGHTDNPKRRIENAMQLYRAGVLQLGDIVQLGEFEYEVRESHLCVLHWNFQNRTVFDYLKLTGTKRHELAEIVYGYKRGNCGSWPSYKNDDYVAATRNGVRCVRYA